MRILRYLAFVLLLGGITGLACPAQEDGEEKLSKDEQAKLDNLEDLLLAHRVAEFGRTYKAPEAMVTAGGILLKVDAFSAKSRKFDSDATDEKGNKLDTPPEKEKTLKDQAEELFEEALGMKPGSKELQALIKAAKTRPYTKLATESRAAGPKRISRRVDAGGRHQFNVGLKGVGTVAMTSSAPVRLIIKARGSTVSNTVVTSYRYTFRAGGKVHIEIHGMGRPAAYTVFAN